MREEKAEPSPGIQLRDEKPSGMLLDGVRHEDRGYARATNPYAAYVNRNSGTSPLKSGIP